MGNEAALAEQRRERGWQAISEPWSQVGVLRGRGADRLESPDELFEELVPPCPCRQGDEPDEAPVAADGRGDGGPVLPSADQTAFPVAGPCSEIGDGGRALDGLMG